MAASPDWIFKGPGMTAAQEIRVQETTIRLLRALEDRVHQEIRERGLPPLNIDFAVISIFRGAIIGQKRWLRHFQRLVRRSHPA